MKASYIGYQEIIYLEYSGKITINKTYLMNNENKTNLLQNDPTWRQRNGTPSPKDLLSWSLNGENNVLISGLN